MLEGLWAFRKIHKAYTGFLVAFDGNVQRRNRIGLVVPLIGCSLIFLVLYGFITYVLTAGIYSDGFLTSHLALVRFPETAIIAESNLTSVVSNWISQLRKENDPGRKLDLASHVKHELHTLKRTIAKLDEELSFYYSNPVTASESTEEDSFHSRKEISIPFYMYDQPQILAFESACHFDKESEQGFGGHMSEYYAAQIAKSHRWRVSDPNHALIFVVPVYLGAALEGSCGSIEIGKDLIKNATETLRASPWFQRFGGNDHLFVGTHWKIFNWFREEQSVVQDLYVWQKFIWARYMAAFEKTFCIVLVPYSTRPLEAKSSEDTSIETFLSSRPYTFFFMGRVFQEHHAHGYSTRRALFNGLQGFRAPNIIVSTIQPRDFPIPSCKSVDVEGSENLTTIEGCFQSHDVTTYDKLASKSIFHFMVRGDDWSSQRLYDIIRIGAIPVILSDGLWDKAMPFGCEVDWDSLVIRIPEKEFIANSIGTIQKYVPDPRDPRTHNDLARRLNVVREFQENLLWTIPSSKVFDNVLRGAVRRCFPEAHLLRSGVKGLTGSPAPKSLKQLTCPFRDYSKNRYVTSRHGVGYFQEGWNQDD